MPKDDTAPLTKADGKMILEIMNQILVRMDEHSKRFDSMDQRMDTGFNDAHNDTALLIENLRSDVIDVRKDQVARHQDWLADHDQRIVSLERKTTV